jgi:protein disulfide-isomerase A6
MSGCCKKKIYVLGDKNFDNNGNIINAPPLMFVLFKASWCPHCRNLQPTWETLVSTYRTTKDCLCFAEVERTENDALFARMRAFDYQIDGFPTLMLFDNRGKGRTLYTRDRTVPAMRAFLDAVMERGNFQNSPKDGLYYERSSY